MPSELTAKIAKAKIKPEREKRQGRNATKRKAIDEQLDVRLAVAQGGPRSDVFTRHSV